MHAAEFVRHALKLAPRVVMFLRLLFIESQSRCDIIDGGQLRRVYPFIDRLPMTHRDNWEGPKIDSSIGQFAWFCWDRNYRGDIIVRRIWAREKPYDALDDFAKSLDVGFAHIRERVAAGGPGWTPPPAAPPPEAAPRLRTAHGGAR
jgi:hypothetical protein